MKYTFLINCFLLFTTYIYSFKNNKLLSNRLLNNKLLMKPNDMIDYLTSIKDYTIITTNDKNKTLQDYMINNGMNVYYVNLNNILDKNEILNILTNKYNYLDNTENLWIFYKGYFFGSKNDIYKVIKNKNI